MNYLAFGESNDEYHNEHYRFIESEEMLTTFKQEKATILYKRQLRSGIRNEQLQESIGEMRIFITENFE